MSGDDNGNTCRWYEFVVALILCFSRYFGFTCHERRGRYSKSRTLCGNRLYRDDFRSCYHGRNKWFYHRSYGSTRYVSDENWEATLSEYESRGLKVMQTGQFHTDKHAYIQVEPNLNFILELGNCPPIELREDEFDMYPAE